MVIGIDHSYDPYIAVQPSTEIPFMHGWELSWRMRIIISCIKELSRYKCTDKKQKWVRTQGNGFREALTKKELKWTPNNIKDTRNLPHQSDHQKAKSNFRCNHWSTFIVLVHKPKHTVDQKSEKRVHWANVIQHVMIIKNDATKEHKEIKSPHHLFNIEHFHQYVML